MKNINSVVIHTVSMTYTALTGYIYVFNVHKKNFQTNQFEIRFSSLPHALLDTRGTAHVIVPCTNCMIIDGIQLYVSQWFSLKS